MKGRLWRKTLAACLALLLVTGNVPIQPVTDLFGDMAITASAEGNTITIDANGQTISDTTTWENCSVNITGNGTVTFSKRIIISGDVTLNISSGTTLTASIGIAVNEGNSLTIDGKGTLNAYGAMYNAGIGSEQNYNAGTIIINDGTINAYGKTYGAGIGGGQNGNGGIITINGGTVNADSKTRAGTYDGFGAGIGGGFKGSGGNITINGGVIVAKSNTGTGIGGGYKGNGGNIAITGGTVTVTTDDNSAGIGGGGGDETIPAGNGGTIAISGGQITVTSGGGYGIGAGKSSSGEDGAEGTITLSWTDESDFISASSYVGDINFVVDKRFYYYDTTDYATKEGLYKQNRKIVPAIGDVSSLAMAKISMEARYYIPTNGTAVNVDYSVYDYNGNELTLGTDYTAVIKNSSNQAVSNVIDEGDYTLTVTAKDGSNYTGSQTVDFSVVVRPEGLSIDDDYTKGQDGYYYINMPKAGTNTLPLPDGFTSSFKVYDDGGKNGAYSNDCDGYLLLTAPEGYVFQLSGSIKTELWDYLYVYDGNDNNAATLINRKSSSTDGSETTVDTVVSSGQSILLYFHTSGLNIYSGLDLVVSVIPDSTKFPITVNQTAGGNVEASATQAKPYDTVNLTSTPESGYLLKELSITDASENNVSVEGGWYTNNCASFIMPGSAVTVKPTFTNELSAEGGLCINMPKTGTQTATIPANVESFKIYDDGGKDGEYSRYCDGTLTLTAPEGYVLKLSGNITTETGDKLTIYDGSSDSNIKLFTSSTGTVDIGSFVSSGKNMTLHFSSDGTWVYDGLDLTVTLVSTSAEFAINGLDDITGGTIEAAVNGSNVTTAKVNDDVSITVSPKSGYLLSSLSVTDGDGRSLEISDILWNNDVGIFSFTMPDSNVTITPTFINTPALYYNIPVFGSQEVTIPSGVQSFKVYDDGGYYNNYSYNCNGTLILTAPTGYVLQLSGNITTDNGFDLLTVYDGDGISTKLIDAAYSSSENTETAITTVTSSGQSMRIFFTSNDHYNYAGLDLTVTLVPITYTVSFHKNVDDATGTMDAQTHTYDAELALTANSFEYTGYTFAGWATTADGEKTYDDQQSVSNLATTQGANVDLYAKWILADYDITAVAEHGTITAKVDDTSAATAHYGDTVVLDVTPDTGYKVKSISVNDTAIDAVNGVYSFTMPAEDVTVSAEFEKQKFTVTWKNEDGTTLETDENVEYGTSPSYDGETPTKTADAMYTYSFAGWSPEISDVTGNVTYTAQFSSTAKSYTITYKVDGEIYKTESVSYGNSITLPDAPTREGYTFSGWQSDYTTMPASDIEITGTFAINQYAVNFVDTDGETVLADAQTINWNEKASAPDTPTKDGFVFLYWTADGTTEYDFETAVTDNLTLQAVWKNEVNATVQLDVSSGVVGGKNSLIYVSYAGELSDGCTVTSVGFYVATNKFLGYTADNTTNVTTLDGYDVKEIMKNNTTGLVKEYVKAESTHELQLRVGANTSYYFYVLPYVIVTDENGSEYVFYGDVSAATFDSVQ